MRKGDYKVLVGDCTASMRDLPDQLINTCITSPPYYGLRDYDHPDQIGQEQTPQEYVDRLVEVFREVRRIMRDDGTLWVNLGDSYYNYRPGKGQSLVKQTLGVHKNSEVRDCPKRANKFKEYKEKDLMGMPWRVAFALQADGWYLRQDIIWSKTNPMPESVKDRCTKAHEYIFLFSKKKHYYFDQESIKEDAKESTIERHKRAVSNDTKYGKAAPGQKKQSLSNARTNDKDREPPKKANKKSVWEVATKSYTGAHFAVYSPELILPCVLAGCPENGTVFDPFGGSGTTAAVAVAYGRNAIMCELNEDYAALMEKRIASVEPEQGELI